MDGLVVEKEPDQVRSWHIEGAVPLDKADGERQRWVLVVELEGPLFRVEDGLAAFLVDA
jgi:hypothetical protein